MLHIVAHTCCRPLLFLPAILKVRSGISSWLNLSFNHENSYRGLCPLRSSTAGFPAPGLQETVRGPASPVPSPGSWPGPPSLGQDRGWLAGAQLLCTRRQPSLGRLAGVVIKATQEKAGSGEKKAGSPSRERQFEECRDPAGTQQGPSRRKADEGKKTDDTCYFIVFFF